MIAGLLQRSLRLVPESARRSIRRWPVIAPLQRALIRRFMEGREFEHVVDAGPARGLRYPVRLPEDKGIWTGTYEFAFANALKSAIRPGDVCYDIGGWRGYFSAVMAMSGAASVKIFEPLPENCAQIRRMLAMNPDLPIELLQLALGTEPGDAEFVVMDQTSMGKLSTSSFQVSQSSGTRIPVRVESIDALVAGGHLPPPDMAKLDVEGAECMVLRGALETLRTARPTLLIEAHSPQLRDECLSILQPLGYDVAVLDDHEPGEAHDPNVSHLLARGR